MESSKIYIKNMVCDRCRLVVKHELEKAGISYHNVELGEVHLQASPSEDQLSRFQAAIAQNGFEIIEDKSARTISKIKGVVIDYVRTDNRKNQRFNFSEYLADRLARDYSSLSKLFSDVEGITIEKYLILQKIERVKELLVYDEMNLSEIAYALNYSSVQHLSNQFKKITGLTPSHFKKIGIEKRKPLDKV